MPGGCREHWRVGILVFALWVGPLWAEGPSEDWLNVRDFGALGSKFETTASTTAGSNQITVKDVGDFKPGQGVMVSRCNVQYVTPMLYGPGEPYNAEGQRPLGDAAEIRGYDGSAGSWLVYILEFDGAAPLTFRWSDDLARTWKATKVPVTHDWQALSKGVEVRINRRDLRPGHFITFTARDQLVSVIEKIERNILTLKDKANRTATDAVVRHCDGAALQAAIDRAIQDKKNLFFPEGYYRLARGLAVPHAGALRIEGASGVDTVLDISDGTGACFDLYRGTEVTIRNFRMVGHTGQAEQPGVVHTSSGYNYWACALKRCNAVTINGTERVLVENVHASRMASECFVSLGPYREGQVTPKEYTRSATFVRCSVTDCAANAFNNCDFAEGTSILYCRIDGTGIGWHAYEGSGRFIRFIGNYVRNAGPVTIGDIPHNLPRLDHYHDLGIGQAIVADNVFEGIGQCGGIAVMHGPTQVVISNNLFINYNGYAIRTSNGTAHNTFPSQNLTISGNILDMTYAGDDARPRVGILAQTSDTTVSNNQIYVRGACDPKVTGLVLRDGAVNVNVHDNLIRNCGRGLITERLEGQVTEVVNASTFRARGIPLQWRTSDLYRGWNLVWLTQPPSACLMESYDPDSLCFRLHPAREVRVGARFHLFPTSANWTMHNNIITGCLRPVVLASYGSATSLFRNNIISRGEASGVKCAVALHGNFQILSNHISGFDERESFALGLFPAPSGHAPQVTAFDNIFEGCTQFVLESQDDLAKGLKSSRNLLINGGAPKELKGIRGGVLWVE